MKKRVKDAWLVGSGSYSDKSFDAVFMSEADAKAWALRRRLAEEMRHWRLDGREWAKDDPSWKERHKGVLAEVKAGNLGDNWVCRIDFEPVTYPKERP